MTTFKETKYLTFATEEIKGRKTKIVHVINKSNTNRLATIVWHSNWRQYCFLPNPEFQTVWNKDCLNDVNSVITKLMEERKNAKI